MKQGLTPDPEDPSGGLSIVRYAAHRRRLGLPGAAPSSVETALADGRIWRTCSEHHRCPTGCRAGRIDPAAADAAWAENSDPTWTRGAAPAGEEPGDPVANFQAERVALLAVRRQAEELRLAVRRGDLLGRPDTIGAIFGAARATRDALMILPRRLSGRLAGMRDRAEIEELLEEEIRAALEVIDRLGERLARPRGAAAARGARSSGNATEDTGPGAIDAQRASDDEPETKGTKP